MGGRVCIAPGCGRFPARGARMCGRCERLVPVEGRLALEELRSIIYDREHLKAWFITGAAEFDVDAARSVCAGFWATTVLRLAEQASTARILRELAAEASEAGLTMEIPE